MRNHALGSSERWSAHDCGHTRVGQIYVFWGQVVSATRVVSGSGWISAMLLEMITPPDFCLPPGPLRSARGGSLPAHAHATDTVNAADTRSANRSKTAANVEEDLGSSCYSCSQS